MSDAMPDAMPDIISYVMSVSCPISCLMSSEFILGLATKFLPILLFLPMAKWAWASVDKFNYSTVQTGETMKNLGQNKMEKYIKPDK